MSSRRTTAVALLALSALAAPHAQQQPPSFRSSTALVAVDAAVVDKDGKPVTDLTAADFEIVDGDQRFPIQTIYLVSSDPAFVRAGQTGPASAPLPSTTAAATSPVRRELRARVMVFVFDLAHLSADGYKRSRDAVESFLKDSGQSADLVGIVAGGNMLNNRIDSNKVALLKALQTMPGPNLSRFSELRQFPRFIDEGEATTVAHSDDRALERVFQRACQERPDECGERLREEIRQKAHQIAAEAGNDAVRSLDTLEKLSRSLGRLPGSKNVLLLSDGYYVDELGQRLRALAATAARNNVRISTLDSRGLNRDPRMQNLMNDQPLTGNGEVSFILNNVDGDILSSLAIDTGGEMIMNRNNLRPGIDLIARTAGSYYMLGYAPARAMDGDYHSIRVIVTRPNVTVRARKGYVAVSADVR